MKYNFKTFSFHIFSFDFMDKLFHLFLIIVIFKYFSLLTFTKILFKIETLVFFFQIQKKKNYNAKRSWILDSFIANRWSRKLQFYLKFCDFQYKKLRLRILFVLTLRIWIKKIKQPGWLIYYFGRFYPTNKIKKRKKIDFGIVSLFIL